MSPPPFQERLPLCRAAGPGDASQFEEPQNLADEGVAGFTCRHPERCMRNDQRYLTGVERRFEPHEIIVSKTDKKGKITYANTVFTRVSQYSEDELLNAPHNIVRHPAMPRCVFKVLWDTIAAGQEIFAYVLNRAKSGDHYWVFAHVTPTFDERGMIIGYHSSRRVAEPRALAKIEPIYSLLLSEEKKHANPRDGMAAAGKVLTDYLASEKMSYEQFVFTL
jgi:PAS domain S-box-containing protein